jgi:tetrachloroethene reductive dehalogenase
MTRPAHVVRAIESLRRVDAPPYTVDPEALARFDQSNDAFALGADDHGARTTGAQLDAADHAEGAVRQATRAVRRLLGEHLLGKPGEPLERTHDRDDPAANTTLVKQAALRLGADLVGVCRVNPNWIYSHDRQGREVELPDGCDFAVVMAVAMDAAATRQSPGPAEQAATSIGYMRASVCAAALGEFVRALGYAAVASLNDTGLSVPLAVDAGLGEPGRHGMLITPELGPCLRLCKVFTDLPLEPDRPVEFGIGDRCATCRACAAACPAGAISADAEPSYNVVCESNSAGVLSWPVDAQKCLAFWRTNGGGCANCVAACPFTPTE